MGFSCLLGPFTGGSCRKVSTAVVLRQSSAVQLAHPLLKAAGKSSVVMISSVAGGPSTVQSGTIYAMLKGVPWLQIPFAWPACTRTS